LSPMSYTQNRLFITNCQSVIYKAKSIVNTNNSRVSPATAVSAAVSLMTGAT